MEAPKGADMPSPFKGEAGPKPGRPPRDAITWDYESLKGAEAPGKELERHETRSEAPYSATQEAPQVK